MSHESEQEPGTARPSGEARNELQGVDEDQFERRQPLPEQDEEETDTSIPMKNTELIPPLLRYFLFLSGQWFQPVRHLVHSKWLRRPAQIAWRATYAVWQIAVVVLMWVFFAYAMGFLGLRTMKEVDWICPLTDLKNMAYAWRWIITQHTGLAFCLIGKCENLFSQLTIKKWEIEKQGTVNTITVFLVLSVLFLFQIPISVHILQITYPDVMPLPGYINGTLTTINKEPFKLWQIVLNISIFVLNRIFSLPIYFVFLKILELLCCEVKLFKEDLIAGRYPTEDKAREKAIKLKKLIKDTEKAFAFFLALYLTMLLLSSALEIFSIAEKVEKVITKNHTVHFMPSLTKMGRATMASTYDLQAWGRSGKIVALPPDAAVNSSYPYLLVQLVPTGNDSSTAANGISATGAPEMVKVVIEQYKLSAFEIAVTALLDITENIVLYVIPLYAMSTLKSLLMSVVEAVEDSDYGEQATNVKIFATRQEKQDFRDYFRDTCCHGIRVLGQEVTFLGTLVITVFGPFVVVVMNLMFKQIHVDPHLD